MIFSQFLDRCVSIPSLEITLACSRRPACYFSSSRFNGSPRHCPDIAKPVGRELRGLEATGKEIPHQLIGEEQHAAVGVVNDEELIRAEQLVGDDRRAKRVVAGAPSGIANNVGISLRESGVLGRIQTGVHARKNRKVTHGWYCQLALRAKRRRVARIRLMRVNTACTLQHPNTRDPLADLMR
jgi:hypothetical protein